MKHLLYSLVLFTLLVGCKTEVEETEVTMETLQGEFMRVRDNGRGGKGHKDIPLVESITFRSKFCNFTYDGTPMSGKYSVDEGYVYIEAGGELGTLSLEIVSVNQLEGEGWINGTFMREGHEGEMKDGGNGSGSHANSSSSEGNDNSSGADGANGDGSDSNAEEASTNATSAGSMNEEVHDASASGTGDAGSTKEAAPKRVVVKHLNTSNMRSNVSTKIGMFLTIDADGRVVAVKLDRSKTTCKNEVLVNSVTAAVKKEVLYNKVPGATYAKVSYVVKL